MGKYINTQYKDTVDGVTSMFEDLLHNSFYPFNGMKPTRIKYWNTNKEKSTLDPGSKLEMVDVGEDSPKRFNVIEDLMAFGLPRLEINLDNGEFGLEAEPISGEMYLMPNTIEPIPGDFFQIEHMLDNPWLFKVMAVDKDTFDNGANVWKVSWKLDRSDDLANVNVVEEYVAIEKQEGTNFKTIIEKKNYHKAVSLDDLCSRLKKYYLDLFFSDPVQTLIYKWLNESNMYDPFLIEFIKRNGILENQSSDYVYIQHQTPLANTFAVDYDRSFYRAFELCDKEALSGSTYMSQADMINSMITVFHSRYEEYFQLTYRPLIGIKPGPFNIRDYIEVFPQDLIFSIVDNKKIDDTRNLYQNIFIKYFNGEDIGENDIKNVNIITYDNSKEIFYMLPLIIFVLEHYTKKLLS